MVYSHGLSRSNGKVTKLYKKWQHIKYRTTDINCKSYKNYGARGIKMCDEWIKSYESFHYWAINNGYSEQLEIDRIDTNGDYEPNNCRFVTKTQNARNKRNNKLEIETVRKIRNEYMQGNVTQRALAYKYNVNHATMNNIIRFKIWKD